MNIYAGKTLSFKWKVLAIFMSVVLACSMCPASALAEAGDSAQQAAGQLADDGIVDEGTSLDDESDSGDESGIGDESGNGTEMGVEDEPGDGADEGDDPEDPDDPDEPQLIDISSATVKLSITEVKYKEDGTTTKPEVESVTLEDGTVLDASEYTVVYPAVTGAGTYTVSVVPVEGSETYTGTATATYKVFSLTLLYASSKSSTWKTTTWKSTAISGSTSGKNYFKKIKVKVNKSGIKGDIVYSVKCNGLSSWYTEQKNGAEIGTGKAGRYIECIKINLTGELAAKYDVYYRVNAPKIGWMDWAKNGQAAGCAAMSIPVRGYQVKLVLKSNPAPGKTALTYAKFRSTNYADAVGKILLVKANYYSTSKCKSKRMIVVSRTYNRMGIFKKSGGKWVFETSKYGTCNWICSTGAKLTPTPAGIFYVGNNGAKYSRGSKFRTDSGNTCYNFTRFRKHTLFHSQVYLGTSKTQLAYPDQLGKNVSHGCIRLEDDKAVWIKSNIANGTKVIVYGELLGVDD